MKVLLPLRWGQPIEMCHGLQEDYRANADVKERISYGTSSYGLQDDNNFWFLGPEVN